jgi:hypothetical protein
MTAKHNIEARRGDTFSLVMRFTDGDGEPIDLAATYINVRMQVRHNDVVKLSFELGDGIAIADTNELVITKAAAAMATMPAQVCNYDIEFFETGGIVSTLVEGTFKVIPDVTR